MLTRLFVSSKISIGIFRLDGRRETTLVAFRATILKVRQPYKVSPLSKTASSLIGNLALSQFDCSAGLERLRKNLVAPTLRSARAELKVGATVNVAL